jgi:hypothetical protein
MASSGSETKGSKVSFLLGAIALCLLVFLAAGWVFQENQKARRLSVPTQLKEGMTRQEVEAILTVRIDDERKVGATGDVFVAYVVEYSGVLTYTGIIVEVFYDGKAKRVAWVDPSD